jgi:hypothetical protein
MNAGGNAGSGGDASAGSNASAGAGGLNVVPLYGAPPMPPDDR